MIIKLLCIKIRLVMKKIFNNALSAWFLMLIFAIINGILRNEWYSIFVGEYWGHVISSIIAMYAFSVIIQTIFQQNQGSYDIRDPLKIGLSYILMTVSFEFFFGHYIAGHILEYLLADYNILNGRIWSLVLLNIIFSSLWWGHQFYEAEEEVLLHQTVKYEQNFEQFALAQ